MAFNLIPAQDLSAAGEEHVEINKEDRRKHFMIKPELVGRNGSYGDT